MFLFSPLVLIVAGVCFITLVVLVELEQWGWSTGLFVGSLVCVHFLMKINLLEYISKNFSHIALIILLSLSLGIIWSIFKWISFLYKFKEVREERLESFRENRKLVNDLNSEICKSDVWPSKSESVKSEYEFLNCEYYKNTNTRLSRSPSYKQYKSKIVAWVIFWIPSLIGTLLNDFVRKFVTWVVNRFSALYQCLSNKIVGDFPETK
jgi:hypothetical protein